MQQPTKIFFANRNHAPILVWLNLCEKVSAPTSFHYCLQVFKVLNFGDSCGQYLALRTMWRPRRRQISREQGMLPRSVSWDQSWNYALCLGFSCIVAEQPIFVKVSGSTRFHSKVIRILNVFLKKELFLLKHFPFITFRPNVCEYVPNGLPPWRHSNIINFKQLSKRGNFNRLENIFHKDYHSSLSFDFFIESE